MAYREPTREEDERLLYMVRQRHEGKTSSKLAEKFGLTKERVRTLTNRVRTDDVRFYGDGVRGAYW